MPVTIYDVAKAAGVGIGTVSRVLNDSGQVRPVTRDKVLKAIEALDYRPHAFARGLASRQTKIIGVIIPHFCNYFFVDLVKGIQTVLADAHYNMILCNVEHPEMAEDYIGNILESRNMDGLIICSLAIPDRFIGLFERYRINAILVDSHHDELDSIMVDNREGAFRATEHLIRLGHRRLGMVDGVLASPPAKQRLEGFLAALKHYGLSHDPEHLMFSEVVTCDDGFSKESGYHTMQRMIAKGGGLPSALFVSSDIQAAGVIKALKEHHFNIPEDISVIGFDDVEIAEYLGLTTMRQPIAEMGRAAATQLIDRIIGAAKGPRVAQTFNTELIERETVESVEN